MVRDKQNRTFILNLDLLALPSIHPGFGKCWVICHYWLNNHFFLAIPTVQNGGNHTPGFTQSAATLPAHYACLDVSKALAATGVRVLTDDGFFAKVSYITRFSLRRFWRWLPLWKVRETFEIDEKKRGKYEFWNVTNDVQTPMSEPDNNKRMNNTM
jgi:hypothetical protein